MRTSRDLMWSLILSLTAGVILGVAPAAVADSDSVSDSEDLGALDISMASHGHGIEFSEPILVHTVTTYRDWDSDLLRNGSGSIRWLFDIDRDRRYELGLRVSATEDGSLYGELDHSGSGRLIGYAKVSRADNRSLTAEFPESLLKRLLRKNGVRAYEWSVSTEYTDPDDPECSTYQLSGHCDDAAGRVRHRIR